MRGASCFQEDPPSRVGVMFEAILMGSKAGVLFSTIPKIYPLSWRRAPCHIFLAREEAGCPTKKSGHAEKDPGVGGSLSQPTHVDVSFCLNAPPHNSTKKNQQIHQMSICPGTQKTQNPKKSNKNRAGIAMVRWDRHWNTTWWGQKKNGGKAKKQPLQSIGHRQCPEWSLTFQHQKSMQVFASRANNKPVAQSTTTLHGIYCVACMLQSLH